MRWRRGTAVAGLAIAAALTGGVAVAASTGTLPIATGRDEGPNPTAVSAASQPHGADGTSAAPTPRGPADTAPNSPNGQGPDATGPAKFGLCNAFASGQGTTNGDKADSVAFQALATAAGGAANVTAFCADATPGSNAPHGEGAPRISSTRGDAPNPNAAHANSASDAHGPPTDPSSKAQSHRP
jgi:hypothetical protein